MKIELSQKVPGNKEEKLKQLAFLNEDLLPMVIADILFVLFHHTNIKIMDGPGDGRRDVLSLNENNEKCITQCKFHEDNSKTVSSRETDEIVIALTKFGCKNGIFCTNSNLSPQSKREYEDNYPNYNVSWFDGEKLYDALMENPILEKIWLEQVPIRDAVNITVLPIFISPVIKIEKDIDFIIDSKINIKISNGNNFYTETQFAPFNSNNVAKSLLNQTIPCLKAFVYGKVYINQLKSIKKSILAKLNEVTFFKHGFFYSIRFGIPHLCFSESEQTIINMPISPETYVYYKNNFLSEKDWFLKLDDNWNLPYYIQSGNADKLCYYNRKFDICLFFYYKSSFQKNILIELQRIITNSVWQHSFFIIVNNTNYQIFLEKNNIPSDIVLPYGDTQTLLGWRVSSSNFRGTLNTSEFVFHEDANYTAFIEKVKKLLPKEYKEISYDKAIKIAELNGYDVLNTNNELILDLSDIIELGTNLPSPITPENRFVKYKMVWIVEGEPSCIDSTFKNIDFTNNNCSYKEYDNYILFEQRFDLINQNSMLDNNQIFFNVFLKLVQKIEEVFNVKHITFQRNTCNFWSELYEVELMDEKGIYENYKIQI